MMFDDDTLNKIWDKALIVKGLPQQLVRKDVCGALIVRNKYGDRSSSFGWEVDHIFPIAKGGDDSLTNLRPMQWDNNRAKGNDYPVYFGAVKANDADFSNVPFTGQYRVNENLQKELNKLYVQSRQS